MKLDYRLFPVIIVILFIMYMFFNKTIERMENTTPTPTPTKPTTESNVSGPLACGTTPSSEADIQAAFGNSAKEACNKISTAAENIEAAMGGVTNILQNYPVFSLVNPNNYRAGDTTVKDEARRIIDASLSLCEITKIQQMIEQMATSLQTNIIDNTQCTYCNPPPELLKYIGAPKCEVSGVKQINVSEVQQKAVLNALISTLLTKTSSVDAQALATVLQKTEGLLSGNQSFEKKGCDYLDSSMSSTQYFEQISSCAQNASNIQENIVRFCGNIGDVVQQNQSTMLQTCLGDVAKEVTQDIVRNQDISSNTNIKQESTGLSTAAIIAIIVACIIISVISSFIGRWVIKRAAAANPVIAAAL